MTYFYLASTVWQTVLLVISQFTVISLAAGIVLLYKRKSSLPKIAGISAVLLINVILYVLMQLESHITDAAQELCLPIPCAVPLLVSLLSAGVGAWAVLGETKNRKMIISPPVFASLTKRAYRCSAI